MNDKLTLTALLAAGTVFTFVWLLLLRKRLDMAWYAAAGLALLHTVYGVFTVTVFAFLETGFEPQSLGNMSLFGGVFFMPAAYALGAKLSKRSYKEVFDIFTPCMIFTVMCARINCILSGCCTGLPMPGLGGALYPTREAEVLFYIVLLAWLCPRIWKGRTQGECYPLYMISYGAFRFVIEFFRRADTTSLFHIAHLWALLTLIAGISIYAEIKTKKQIKRRRR